MRSYCKHVFYLLIFLSSCLRVSAYDFPLTVKSGKFFTREEYESLVKISALRVAKEKGLTDFEFNRNYKILEDEIGRAHV